MNRIQQIIIYDRVLIDGWIRSLEGKIGLIGNVINETVAMFYPIVAKSMERNEFDLGNVLFGKVNPIKKDKCLNLWKARMMGDLSTSSLSSTWNATDALFYSYFCLVFSVIN